MKKFVTAGIVLALLVCLTSAYAGTAGSASDPLISRTYIDTTYNNSIITAGETAIKEGLEAAYNSAVSQLGGGTDGGVSVAQANDYLSVPSGSSVTLTTGSSIIVTGGSVSVSVSSGAVINISTAEEVPSGTVLSKNIRYFCAEDTKAVFTATEVSVCAVNGGYTPGSGVTAVFTKYTDVSATDWFYDAAVYACNSKIFRDYDSSSFRPNSASTRAETVYALWVAVGAPASSTTAAFSDLNESWYMAAVSWAVENNIINGAENNTFKPNDSLTREQLATIMYRYAQYSGENVNVTSDMSVFKDANKISSWAYDQMCWANAIGLITGTSKTEMSPQMAVTRAQLATVLMRRVEE
ncbi:MAG: S-layer homology domain-containing protein [Oscillospiraceae bacterium]